MNDLGMHPQPHATVRLTHRLPRKTALTLYISLSFLMAPAIIKTGMRKAEKGAILHAFGDPHDYLPTTKFSTSHLHIRRIDPTQYPPHPHGSRKLIKPRPMPNHPQSFAPPQGHSDFRFQNPFKLKFEKSNHPTTKAAICQPKKYQSTRPISVAAE